MAHGLEMTEKLLNGANDLNLEAQMFDKNSVAVNKAAENYAFWACSYPCLIIFGILGAIGIYFLIK